MKPKPEKAKEGRVNPKGIPCLHLATHEDTAMSEVRPRPFSVKRMKPKPEKAKEGRVNPKGIPCLHLATHEDTAMSEVRPWHKARISLARFELTQAVVLVDCSQEWPNDLTNT